MVVACEQLGQTFREVLVAADVNWAQPARFHVYCPFDGHFVQVLLRREAIEILHFRHFGLVHLVGLLEVGWKHFNFWGSCRNRGVTFVLLASTTRFRSSLATERASTVKTDIEHCKLSLLRIFKILVARLRRNRWQEFLLQMLQMSVQVDADKFTARLVDICVQFTALDQTHLLLQLSWSRRDLLLAERLLKALRSVSTLVEQLGATTALAALLE